jgi:hypothetical protein
LQETRHRALCVWQMIWQVKGNAVNRKQFVAVAFAAAIPAYLLVAAMVWALFQGGMLGDEAKVSVALWVIFVISALGGIIIGVLPFAIVIFPGLYPMAATVSGSAPAPVPQAAPGVAGRKGKQGPEEEAVESPEESAESADEFGDASEFDEFDEFDEFADEVEEEPPQPKKKGRK